MKMTHHAAFLACLLSVTPVLAQTTGVPLEMSYQAIVTDDSGAPLAPIAPVSYEVTMRIFDAVTDGTLLWSERQVAEISQGRFSIILGQGQAVPKAGGGNEERPDLTTVFSGALRFTEITVRENVGGAVAKTLAPRQKLVATATAMRAKVAESLGTGSNIALTALDNGNVGIGENDPSGNLHVAGSNTLANIAGSGDIIVGSREGQHLSFDNRSISSFSNNNTQDNLFINYWNNGGAIFLTGASTTSKVSVGQTALQEKFNVKGNIQITGTYMQQSDRRYKTAIMPLAGALDKVEQLNGVSYKWKVDEFSAKGFSSERQLGFIAQDVREVFPEIVSEDSQGYLSVAYGSLIPVLAEGIKELKAAHQVEVQETKESLTSLQTKFTQVQDRLGEKEREVEALESRLNAMDEKMAAILALLSEERSKTIQPVSLNPEAVSK